MDWSRGLDWDEHGIKNEIGIGIASLRDVIEHKLKVQFCRYIFVGEIFASFLMEF